VKPSLIDTDILSFFFRNHHQITSNFSLYLEQYEKINFSIITFYEIVSGLKHRDAHKQMKSFLDFSSENRVLPITEHSVKISAEIYADLRKQGKPVDDIDLLIAGTAISNNMVLITHNRSHFERISRLEIIDWCSE
jgi:tRNA(fMet)-specific endonuclease VapC